MRTQGGSGSSQTTGTSHVDIQNAAYGQSSNVGLLAEGVARGIAAYATLGASEGVYWLTSPGHKISYDIPGGTREMWATFDRDSRMCQFCSSVVTKDCNSVYKRGFVGIGQKTEVNCTESEPVEKCDDIKM